jgi:HEAT repeat protein
MKSRRAVFVVAVVLIAVAVVTLWVVIRSRRLDAELHDPSPAVRLAAVRTLDRNADVDLLIAALKDDDADVRLVAAWRLGGTPGPAEKRVSALIEALKDRHAGVRRAAAESLWSIGPASGPALIAALKDPNPRLRAGAIFALQSEYHKEERKRAPGEVEAIRPLLEDLLHDDDPEVRRNAEKFLPLK